MHYSEKQEKFQVDRGTRRCIFIHNMRRSYSSNNKVGRRDLSCFGWERRNFLRAGEIFAPRKVLL